MLRCRVVVNIDGTETDEMLEALPRIDPIAALLNVSSDRSRLHASRRVFDTLKKHNVDTPVLHHREFEGKPNRSDISIITGSEIGGLLVDGLGDGVLLEALEEDLDFLVSTSFALLQVRATQITKRAAPHPAAHCLHGLCCLGICRAAPRATTDALCKLQGSRMRNTKTEYVSCPSCGRTLFDLQEVTAQISERTGHLPGVTIAVMGCIVNGPGEMADADFGYVGGAPGKIDLLRTLGANTYK